MGKFDYLRKAAYDEEHRFDLPDATEVKEPAMKPWDWITLASHEKRFITDPNQLREFEPWIVNHMLGSNQDVVEVAESVARMRLPKETVFLYYHDILPHSRISTKMYRVQSLDPKERLRREIVAMHYEIGTNDAKYIIDFHGEELIDEHICVNYPDLWTPEKKKRKKKT